MTRSRHTAPPPHIATPSGGIRGQGGGVAPVLSPRTVPASVLGFTLGCLAALAVFGAAEALHHAGLNPFDTQSQGATRHGR